MNFLVTGADGFIGKNLVLRLTENSDNQVFKYVRGDSDDYLLGALKKVDVVFHLAGENRPDDLKEFQIGNADLTSRICELLGRLNSPVLLIFSSSTQADLDSPYGRSKLASEEAVKKLAIENGNPIVIYRLPGVFGKWCKPNYNSVVATFCHNLAQGLPIKINDPHALVDLVYIDDVIFSFIDSVQEPAVDSNYFRKVKPTYSISLGDLAEQIESFKDCRTSLISARVGQGFTRALHSTYVSYLPTTAFSYEVPVHGDERGVFVEMLKTQDSGQFSFFTAHPGVTRGGHYHHTKTEKFLVIKGNAEFGFRNILTDEKYSLKTSGKNPEVVETIPGWTHDISNIGDDELVVMLWANEIFDQAQPDTITCEV